MSDNYSLILTTIDCRQEAERLAERILERKLAACVQIQKIKSFYRWNGKIERGDECLLLMKTRASLWSKLSEFIRQNHSYQTPEVVQISIGDGSREYLDWLEAVTIDPKDCE
ncbi:MAG: divalent-cation tolerance protein CutA [Holosporaceae bacterium]|jgi:periplasmic divalent cation tolerance protein|nr:divalent-cation tolerance protein CutA [Holosporaceae bacterium]